MHLSSIQLPIVDLHHRPCCAAQKGKVVDRVGNPMEAIKQLVGLWQYSFLFSFLLLPYRCTNHVELCSLHPCLRQCLCRAKGKRGVFWLKSSSSLLPSIHAIQQPLPPPTSHLSLLTRLLILYSHNNSLIHTAPFHYCNQGSF